MPWHDEAGSAFALPPPLDPLLVLLPPPLLFPPPPPHPAATSARIAAAPASAPRNGRSLTLPPPSRMTRSRRVFASWRQVSAERRTSATPDVKPKAALSAGEPHGSPARPLPQPLVRKRPWPGPGKARPRSRAS